MLIILIVCIIVLVILEIIREQSGFTTVHYDIKNAKLTPPANKSKKIVFLSDLHNRCYGVHNQLLVTAIQREQPDIILIGGDMLIGKSGCPYETALDVVGRLTNVAPVYYANGNHEQRMKERPQKYQQSYRAYQMCLKQAGVHFLENSYVSMELGGMKLRIYGIEIPLTCYKHWGNEKLEVAEIKALIGSSNPSEYNLLLAHNPGFMDTYLKWGADLVLSGHLHGGIARIPGIGGVIAPDFKLFPRYSGGRYQEGNKDVIVSKGLGSHTIPIRFCNPAELVVITLSAPEDL